MGHAKLSRMEANKEARRVLSRHRVDLSYCMYSCSGNEVRLTGELIKSDGGDFSATMIEGMIQEFCRKLPGFAIVGELDNWSFSGTHITSTGKGKEEEEKEKDEQKKEGQAGAKESKPAV
jgi:hypothetical protein